MGRFVSAAQIMHAAEIIGNANIRKNYSALQDQDSRRRTMLWCCTLLAIRLGCVYRTSGRYRISADDRKHSPMQSAQTVRQVLTANTSEASWPPSSLFRAIASLAAAKFAARPAKFPVLFATQVLLHTRTAPRRRPMLCMLDK
jgi:hypothetical protein